MIVKHGASLFALAAILAAGGCQLIDEPKKLQDELAKSTAALNEAKNENKRLAEQVRRQDERILSLMALGEKRLEKLYYVTSIALGDYTGGISTDGSDWHDAVKVFLLPTDQDGAVLKAAGSVKIQLYDLAAASDQNLIGECEYGIDEVRKHWSSGFLTYHFSFVCPWKKGLRPHEDVTVRVEFVEYLTGKHLTAQKVVKVKPAPAGGPVNPAPPPSRPTTESMPAAESKPAVEPPPATASHPATSPSK